MTAQRPQARELVDVFLDLDALRRRANAHTFPGVKPNSRAKPRVRSVLVAAAALGLAVSAIAATTLASAPANHAVSVTSSEHSTFADQIKRNVEALRRSRRWWQHFAHHLRPSQQQADRSAALAD